MPLLLRSLLLSFCSFQGVYSCMQRRAKRYDVFMFVIFHFIFIAFMGECNYLAHWTALLSNLAGSDCHKFSIIQWQYCKCLSFLLFDFDLQLKISRYNFFPLLMLTKRNDSDEQQGEIDGECVIVHFWYSNPPHKFPFANIVFVQDLMLCGKWAFE